MSLRSVFALGLERPTDQRCTSTTDGNLSLFSYELVGSVCVQWDCTRDATTVCVGVDVVCPVAVVRCGL